MLGKVFIISGMTIKIVSDDGERWEACNTTTNETVFFDKSFLEKSIRLGKAEEMQNESYETK